LTACGRRMLLVLLIIQAATWHVARPARAAFEGWQVGADVCGLSVSGVSLDDPLFIPFINPAAYREETCWRLSTFYSRRFDMRELTRIALALSRGGHRFVWSMGAERFGNDLYGEEVIVLGLGFPFLGRSRVGLSGKFCNLWISGYGTAAAPALDIGWSTLAGDGLRLGAVWRNVNRPELGLSGEEIPGGLIVGVSGTISGRLSWTVEDRRLFPGGSGVGFGVAGRLYGGFRAEMGYRRETGEYSMGATMNLSLLRWDYSVSIHPMLGITHYISMAIGFGGPGPRW